MNPTRPLGGADGFAHLLTIHIVSQLARSAGQSLWRSSRDHQCTVVPPSTMELHVQAAPTVAATAVVERSPSMSDDSAPADNGMDGVFYVYEH